MGQFVSTFDLFKVGIGPSSSHMVGPMIAANRFLNRLVRLDRFDKTARIVVELYGSLALTAIGHGTDRAVVCGLMGELPDTVDPDAVPGMMDKVKESRRLNLLGRRDIEFRYDDDIILLKEEMLPFHQNAMRLSAYDAYGDGGVLLEKRIYYSVGGGFVLSEDEAASNSHVLPDDLPVPYEYQSADDILVLCQEHNMSIAELTLANEAALRSVDDVFNGMRHIWDVMKASVEKGMETDGILPGGLKVKRRAGEFYRSLCKRPEAALRDPVTVLDWVNLFALAVSEENAAGGRVVTAPTNGAAGIIPAVLSYYERLVPSATEKGIMDFMLTASAIGGLYKNNASISGAEVGCQGEVGVACSMAAAGLTAALGGTPDQVENAAEIAMEHNLGLTCDPVGGLVQVPCIERNAMGAVKAINATRLALRGDGQHMVPLDAVIETMHQTGIDMQHKYKETAQGGLAVNVVMC